MRVFPSRPFTTIKRVSGWRNVVLDDSVGQIYLLGFKAQGSAIVHLPEWVQAASAQLQASVDSGTTPGFPAHSNRNFSLSVTNKLQRLQLEIAVLQAARHRQGNGIHPLRILYMGDGEQDMPSLLAEIPDVELLPVYVGPLSAEKMLRSVVPHAQGAAAVLAGLLSPEDVRQAIMECDRRFPTAEPVASRVAASVGGCGICTEDSRSHQAGFP